MIAIYILGIPTIVVLAWALVVELANEVRASREHRRDNPDAFGDEPRKVRAASRAVTQAELRALRPANTPTPVHEAEEA